MHYHLSRRQEKELERGKILAIALPVPPDMASRSAGMAGILGEIKQSPEWPVQVRCIVAQIGDVGGILPDRVQWPGSVQTECRTLPE